MILTESMDEQAWLAWRQTGITASDVPAILGLSKFRSRQDVFREKIGELKKEYVTNFAIERGRRLEPVIRSVVEIEHMIDFPPVFAVHDEFSFIKASPDGFNQKHNIGIEIKVPNKLVYQDACNNKISDSYKAQCAVQRMCTNADEIIFCVFYVPHKEPDENGKLVKVSYKKDDKYEAYLLNELKQFWDCVQRKHL